MNTDALITQLAAAAGPVRRLAPPWRRAALWLAIAMPFVAVVVVLASPRADLAARISDARFLVEEIAAFATAVAAAIAGFALLVPGGDRRLALVPIAPLAIWLASLGQGCVATLLHPGQGARLTSDWMCLPAIVMVGAVPALAMVLMLRRGAPLAPRLSATLGALASAALANVGLRLFHTEDASLTVLVWQFGSVALLSTIAACFGDRLLDWPHTSAVTSPPRRTKY